MNHRNGLTPPVRFDTRHRNFPGCAALGTRAMDTLARVLLLLLAVITALQASTAISQTLLPNPTLPRQGIGRVESTIVQSDGKIIVGGSFG